jgi:hypothetical protein
VGESFWKVAASVVLYPLVIPLVGLRFQSAYQAYVFTFCTVFDKAVLCVGFVPNVLGVLSGSQIRDCDEMVLFDPS